tara:strand:+ start:287 stop:442 length:156 start_codon:yes stop_codon:yes gene_type:complete
MGSKIISGLLLLANSIKSEVYKSAVKFILQEVKIIKEMSRNFFINYYSVSI